MERAQELHKNWVAGQAPRVVHEAGAALLTPSVPYFEGIFDTTPPLLRSAQDGAPGRHVRPPPLSNPVAGRANRAPLSMSKLSIFVAPLGAVAAVLVLIGQAGWLPGNSTDAPPPSASPEELEGVLDAYRKDRTLKSAADLLDAAIRLDSARAQRSKRLEAFGLANQPGGGDPGVGYVLDLDGEDQRLVLFEHRSFPEHSAIEREIERAAADPWYEADEGLLLRVEARVESTFPRARAR